MDVSNRRIVILGKSGTGKSSVANTIVGEERFKIGCTVNSETSKCRAETKSVNGRDITLIDTPGLFDTDRSEELKSEIVKCITEFAPGPHAFLIVLKVEKFTEQDQAVITKIKEYFSEEVFKYATVLFTHGEQLPKGQTIEDFVRDNKLLGDLVEEKCGGRCHVIDNKYWKNNQQDEYRSNQFQVKELLNTIEKMIEANKGSCYTNEMLQAEEERIRQSSGNMSEEEIRKKAKERVFKSVLMLLAGITTSGLLGAIFGRAMVIKKVLSVVKARFAIAKIVAPVGTAGIAIIATCVVLGAVAAGVAGYYAIKETETPLEAAKTAAEVNKNGSKSIVDVTKSKEKSE